MIHLQFSIFQFFAVVIVNRSSANKQMWLGTPSLDRTRHITILRLTTFFLSYRWQKFCSHSNFSSPRFQPSYCSSNTYTWFIKLQNDAWQILREREKIILCVYLWERERELSAKIDLPLRAILFSPLSEIVESRAQLREWSALIMTLNIARGMRLIVWNFDHISRLLLLFINTSRTEYVSFEIFLQLVLLLIKLILQRWIILLGIY
jgi:hypothetical protein